MKTLNRGFSLKEKLILLALALLLLIGLYYFAVDQPVRKALENAETSRLDLESENELLQAKLTQLKNMENELDGIQEKNLASAMPSYNASKAEIALLNDILKDKATEYNVSFDEVTRQGDQIRRPFTMTYLADNYETAREILGELSDSQIRCVVSEIDFHSVEEDLLDGQVSVSLNACFFETMVGGKEDAGLPADQGDEDSVADQAAQRGHAYDEE